MIAVSSDYPHEASPLEHFVTDTHRPRYPECPLT